MSIQTIEWTRLRLMCRQPKLFMWTEMERFSSHIAKVIEGTEKNILPSRSNDIHEELFLAWFWTHKGHDLDPFYCADLESRAKAFPSLWPLATRIHIQQSPSREVQARLTLSEQQLPFSLPNVLDEIQVEVIASGDMVLNALHVDWVRKLAKHTLDALVLDCRHLGLWFEPILDTLPEKLIRKALLRIPRARKLQDGSLGLAAYYAWRLNMPTDRYLKQAGESDHDFFALACTVSK